MKILFIFRKSEDRPSIYRNFEPMMNAMKQEHEISELFLPYGGGNPINILKNILFVKAHRIKDGVNHVTGEVHYAILGLKGVPSVLTIHDDYAMRCNRRGLLGKWFKWTFWMYLPIKMANKVVCTNPTVKKAVDKYVKNNKTQVCLHQDMTGDYPYTPKTFNKLNPRIFLMGTAPNKNLENSLRALQGLKCDIHILKKMTEDQKVLAKQLGVEYTNRYDLTNEEVFREYNEADIVLFPSLFEGLGMPILEGQSIGRIVITSNREPMNWVAGKKGAILVDNPEDYQQIRKAIELAISDNSLREECIQSGLTNVKRFSLPLIIKEYTKIYSEAIKYYI